MAILHWCLCLCCCVLHPEGVTGHVYTCHLNRVKLTDGEFQRLLDDLIAAESRKLDALKAHEKGLMQQLFPAPEGAGA